MRSEQLIWISWFNQQILDRRIWDELFIELPLAELLPGFRNPLTGEELQIALKRLKINSFLKSELTWFSRKNRTPGIFFG